MTSYGLTNDQIRNVCPSAFGTPASKTSDNYLNIPTVQIVDRLRDMDFAPVWATESKTRVAGTAGHTKHMIRFTERKYLNRPQEERPEVVLINSYDWTSAYRFIAGIFRLVCSNGLISGDTGAELRVLHRGDYLAEILATTYKIAEQAEATMETVALMKQVMLSGEERMLLARYAIKARFGDESPKIVEGELVEQPIHSPMSALTIRRTADRSNDLFTVTNRLQENLLRCGVYDNRGNRSRKVKEIGKTVQFNQLLWQFAQELRAQKTGAASTV